MSTTNKVLTLGSLVKEGREAHKMDVDALAKVLGCRPAYVKTIEADRPCWISAEMVDKVYRAVIGSSCELLVLFGLVEAHNAAYKARNAGYKAAKDAKAAERKAKREARKTAKSELPKVAPAPAALEANCSHGIALSTCVVCQKIAERIVAQQSQAETAAALHDAKVQAGTEELLKKTAKRKPASKRKVAKVKVYSPAEIAELSKKVS